VYFYTLPYGESQGVIIFITDCTEKTADFTERSFDLMRERMERKPKDKQGFLCVFAPLAQPDQGGLCVKRSFGYSTKPNSFSSAYKMKKFGICGTPALAQRSQPFSFLTET
jgi:hypothetical protein